MMSPASSGKGQRADHEHSGNARFGNPRIEVHNELTAVIPKLPRSIGDEHAEAVPEITAHLTNGQRIVRDPVGWIAILHHHRSILIRRVRTVESRSVDENV